MLTRFIEKCIKGAKGDYFRKVFGIYANETSVETVSSSDVLTMAQRKNTCADFCASCVNASLCEAMTELSKLTERQKYVIEKLYYDRRTENDIAKMLGISQQAVHYHKTEALKKLRRILAKP
jgi:RNA polymerase sigma factor (sigma-70 family)